MMLITIMFVRVEIVVKWTYRGTVSPELEADVDIILCTCTTRLTTIPPATNQRTLSDASKNEDSL